MSNRPEIHHQQQHQQRPDPDVVPGDPPVPVNIWRLPAGDDSPVGDQLATRLLAEYTRHGEYVYDTIPSPALRKAARAAGRGYRAANRFPAPADAAALAVVTWPLADRADPVRVFEGLRRRLHAGGYLAVLVTPEPGNPAGQPPVELGPLVADAIAAGLAYLQHIVTMPTPPPETAAPAPAPAPAATAAAAGDGVHERVHADILVFARIGGGDA